MAECKLPRVMVIQILSRMPPKSLMRFKCIHKSWNSLINSRHVVAKHLQFHNNVSSSTTILLRRPVIWRTETKNEEIVFSLLTLRNENNGDEDNLDYDIEDIQFPPSIGLKTRAQFIENPGPTYECADIVGHCGGIICLSLYAAGDLVLYNPAIREFKLIPEPCLPRPRQFYFRCDAFGYDPKSEDYILVNVASYGENRYDDDRLVIEPLRAEMYTLGTDSWGEIKIHNLETETTMFRPNHFQVYFKGNCYGLAEEIKKEFISSFDSLEEYYIREVIVWFNTSDRVFHSALTPDCLYRYPAHDFTLTVWNNFVALFGYNRCGSKPFEIWVMGDSDGFTCSWIKHLSVNITESPQPLVLWESNQSLLVSPRIRVALYSFATKTFKYLPLCAAEHFDAIPLVNSIVPLNRDLVCADIS
ncbi:F-box/kelch-repeat protein At3g16740-like [Rosa rugosa]|uniref:F-box/kelch-repeat protein At3g16740-like n=1 Tax=Rosa rugosa TaxID=74645 RepID=UPI002B408343|nr:F-box/kelch-repeat protein At3g16740-like [Rosa rugosa]